MTFHIPQLPLVSTQRCLILGYYPSLSLDSHWNVRYLTNRIWRPYQLGCDMVP